MKSEFSSVYHFLNAQQAFVVFPKVDEHIGRSIDDHQQRWDMVRELWKWQLGNKILIYNHSSIKMIVILINWWIEIEQNGYQQLEALRGVQASSVYECDCYPDLGKGGISKSDEFLEKFQTAFDPPPLIFEKSCCAFFPEYMT